MKRKICLLLLSLFILPFGVLAQDIDTQNETNEEILNLENGSAGLGNISFGFCNEGLDNLSNSLNYAIPQGTPFKICAYLQNDSDYDASIEIRIVDIVPNSIGDKICNYNSTKIHDFINKDDLESLKEIKIPAHNYIIKEISLTYPVGIEGDQESCLTYHVLGGSSSDAMVQVIHNRKFNMKFFVGSLENVKNELEMSDININKNDNGILNLSFNLKNVGNLENSIILNGKIKNILGFEREFTFDAGNLNVGEDKPIVIELGSIPSYGGLFNIEILATATPFFSYDISHSNIDPELLEDKTFTVTKSYFQMPWLILIIVVLVILFLIVAFRKPKGKNQQQAVYVQAPQQPQAPQQ